MKMKSQVTMKSDESSDSNLVDETIVGNMVSRKSNVAVFTLGKVNQILKNYNYAGKLSEFEQGLFNSLGLPMVVKKDKQVVSIQSQNLLSQLSSQKIQSPREFLSPR
jgi:hypothetical protein